jgi:predicted transcriptional regulator
MKSEYPAILMRELLNKDRIKYIEIIKNSEDGAGSLDVAREILRSRGITEEEEAKKENIIINKRLRKLFFLGVLVSDEATYTLSGLGYLLLDSWKEFAEKVDTMDRFGQFFDTHYVNDLPQEFFRQIYKLRKTRLTANPVEWMQELEKHTEKTISKLYILTEMLHSIPDEIIAKKKTGETKEIVVIYQFYNYPELNYSIEEEFFNKLDNAGVEFRQIVMERNHHPIGLRIVDDTWATFGLTRIADGVLDREKMFIGTDPDFISWCRDLMYHIWHFRAKPLDTNEVVAKEKK